MPGMRIPVLGLALLLAAPAAAQDAVDPEPTASFPILLRSVSVPLAEGVLEPGGDAREVMVRIVIGVDGAVSDAQLVAPSGDDALDAAALLAARNLQFHPAQMGGQAVEVTLEYPIVFLPPPPVAPEVLPSSISGKVEVKGSREAVGFIDVALFAATLKPEEERREDAPKGDDTDVAAEDDSGVLDRWTKVNEKSWTAEDYTLADEASATTTTAEDGTFTLPDVPPGTYVVALGSGGYRLEKYIERLPENVRRQVVYRIRPTGVPETIVVARQANDAPERVLSGDQLKKMPGAGRDPMAAIRSLPGVIHTAQQFAASADAQAPILRGASAEDSVLYLDGLPVPIIYHSMTNQSVTGDRIIESAFLRPAAVEARYGDLTGGVVGLTLRSPKKDRIRGHIDPGIGEASGSIEGPITEKSRFYVGIRRSYFELILGPIINEITDIDFAVSPFYQDQQILFEADPAPWITLGLGYIGTIDGMQLLRGPDDEDDPNGILFHMQTDMHRFYLKGDMRAKWGFTNRAHLALTFWNNDLQFTDAFNTRDDHITVHVADDAHFPVAPWLDVDAGAILEIDSLKQIRDVPVPTREDSGPRASAGGDENISGSQSGVRAWVGAYAGATFKPVQALSITPEFRIDYFDSIKEAVPGVRARIGIEPIKQLRFSIAGGTYAQAPSSEELNEVTGNPDLTHEAAYHANVGATIVPGPWLDVNVQGYFKYLEHQVVSSSQASSAFGGFADFGDLFSQDDPEPGNGLSNSGVGRVYGMELFARFGTLQRVGITGFLGYSLSWAERRDFEDEEWRYFQHDRRHGVTALVQFKLPGAPTTPVVDSTYYADAGFWVPEYGPLYSGRGGPFHQLDLRIDKTFRQKLHTVEIYIDVQNVYASANTDFEIPSYDYRTTVAFTNIPLINFGVRVEF
jgi:TonB family protein